MINSKYQINIDDSVFEQLHQYRQINGSETGGILLGYIFATYYLLSFVFV